MASHSAGTIVLQGGGPFVANDALDRELVTGAERVVVLPTADAFEQPEVLVAAAMSWAERLDVTVEALMVLTRHDALEPGAAAPLEQATVVYLVGDQPLHLRAVLKDTPLWDALVAVLGRGGTLVACAGSAAALCDPMVDPRGGAFTLGLGLVGGMALMTEAEKASPERRQRTIELAREEGISLVMLPTGSSIRRAGDAEWEHVGDVEQCC